MSTSNPALERSAALMAPTAADAAIAARIFAEARIPAVLYETFEALIEAIAAGVGTVVVIEECLNSREAGHLMAVLADQPAWSSVPFVVLTNRAAHQARPSSVLNSLPNAILLERPVVIAGLISAVRAGLATRGRQYEIRDLLTAAQRASEERARLHEAAEEAKSAAMAANRMKDEFLAVLSHELRTPLNAILGWAKLLQRKSIPPEEQARAVDTIERNARLQAQMIADLLDVSRIISGTLRLEVQEVELVQVIEEALATVTPAAQAKGIRIQKALDPGAGPVAGDPARLQQVIWNLLSNAVKFTPLGGRVHIQLRTDDSYAEISVTDTGEGIAPVFVSHVFERFRQADASTTRKHGGLGLGLAIVRQLVELHGGEVGVTSAGEGQGATFTVRLPVAASRQRLLASVVDPVRRDEVEAPREMSSLMGLNVLVIDDEPECRNLVAAVIGHHGGNALTADSVAAGLAQFNAHAPTVVICDIGMPGQDGYAFARELRKREESSGRWTPVIALTAYARAEDRARILAAGFQVHMPKPVDPLELAAVVAGLAKTVAQ
jgi:signal transduction histidine kinase/CheY-like chemotaxis protein